MKVSVSNRQRALAIDSKQVKKIVIEVVRFEKKTYDEVAIHLVNRETICALHADYFNDPSPTDCISFPLANIMERGYSMLGDVFVCPEEGLKFAHEHLLDPYDEVTLYIVHGLLHLMGYDDLEKKERAKMRSAERRHMKHLKLMGLSLCKGYKKN